MLARNNNEKVFTQLPITAVEDGKTGIKNTVYKLNSDKSKTAVKWKSQLFYTAGPIRRKKASGKSFV